MPKKSKKTNGDKKYPKRPNPYFIDDENPEWTDEDFRNARPAREVIPGLIGKKAAEELFAGKIEMVAIGRPKKEYPKIRTTIRLDQEIINEFRSHGRGWQTEINHILHEWLANRPQA